MGPVDDSPLTIEAGNAVIDVDGELDIIFSGDSQSNQIWWWENPYPNYDPAKSWKRYTIKKTGAKKHHDLLAGDFDNDNKPELVFWNQGDNTLYISEIPANPKLSEDWLAKDACLYLFQ